MTRNVRNLLAALAALTLVATGSSTSSGSSTQESIDWGSLPYYAYRYDNGEAFFYIPTNGNTFDAYTMGGKYTGFDDFDARTSEQLGQGLGVEAIWKPKCPPVDSQTVTLTRDVYLPGTPSKLLVNILPYVWDPAYHDNHSPFAWASVRINKTEVARIEKSAPVSVWQEIDATAQASAVTLGLNTIQIVAKKAKTKKKWDFCWNKKPTFGVEAEIYGELIADLSVSIPPGSGSGTNVSDTTATISNLGPTGAVDGQFYFRSYDGTGGDITVIELSGSGMTCESGEAGTGDGIVATCDLPDLPSGSSVTVDIHLEWTGTCPGDLNIPTGRTATSRWRDPNLSNNQSPAGAGIKCASTEREGRAATS